MKPTDNQRQVKLSNACLFYLALVSYYTIKPELTGSSSAQTECERDREQLRRNPGEFTALTCSTGEGLDRI